MLHTTEVMVILWYFAYFGQNLVAMATFFRPLQSQISSLDWPTPKTTLWTKTFVNNCYTSEVVSIRRFPTSYGNRECPNVWYFSNKYGTLLPAALRAAKRASILVTQRPILRFSPGRGDTFHRWRWNLSRRSGPSMPNFTPISATIRV